MVFLGVIFFAQGEDDGVLILNEQSSFSPAESNHGNIESTKNGLFENSFLLFGKVKEVGDGYLLVEAPVTDLEKLNTVIFSTQKTELPVIFKKYRVNISNRTEFTAVKFSEIYDNAYITVESKEGIYTTNELTAIKVTIPPVEELAIIAEKNKKINEAISNGTYQGE